MTTPGIFRQEYQEYKEHFKKFIPGHNRVHTITVLVGNGFDIAALDLLGSSRKTTYSDFFRYLQSLYFNPFNKLYKMMNDLRLKDSQATHLAGKVPNWSDFENSLQEFISTRRLTETEEHDLDRDLEAIQVCFSDFLEEVVPSRATNQLGSLAREKGWGLHTYSSFLADLSETEYVKLFFPQRIKNYDIFNFVTLNFNFTSLLDNYLYLDKKYDRHPFATSDTNFQFHINPRNYKLEDGKPDSESGSSSYLLTNIYHPHGMQQVPRSLLFGVDEGTSNRTTFEKPFWAQHHRYYEDLIKHTDLFIIFGSSMGQTDRWWWKRILERIRESEAEAIIYKYDRCASLSREDTCDKVRRDFIEQNFPGSPVNPTLAASQLQRRIAVVPYSDPQTLTAFGFCPAPFEMDTQHLYNFYRTVDYPLPQLKTLRY